MTDTTDELDAIGQQCINAVLDGGETWTRFMSDAEQQMGLPWTQIKDLLDERYRNQRGDST